MNANNAIHTQNLCKSFGGMQAVRDISFDVRQGEISSLLGPNGAGSLTCATTAYPSCRTKRTQFSLQLSRC